MPIRCPLGPSGNVPKPKTLNPTPQTLKTKGRDVRRSVARRCTSHPRASRPELGMTKMEGGVVLRIRFRVLGFLGSGVRSAGLVMPQVRYLG